MILTVSGIMVLYQRASARAEAGLIQMHGSGLVGAEGVWWGRSLVLKFASVTAFDSLQRARTAMFVLCKERT